MSEDLVWQKPSAAMTISDQMTFCYLQSKLCSRLHDSGNKTSINWPLILSKLYTTLGRLKVKVLSVTTDVRFPIGTYASSKSGKYLNTELNFTEKK